MAAITSWRLLRKRHKVVKHLWVLGGSQTGNRIPSWGAREALAIAFAIRRHVADGNVVKHGRVVIESRVDKANRLLALGKSLIVNTRKHGGNDWGRHGRAAVPPNFAIGDDDAIVAHCRDIGISTTSLVVDAVAASWDCPVACSVGWEARVVVGQIPAQLVKSF